MARLALQLLGPWNATTAEEPITSFKYDKVRALLTYLAIEATQAHRRETLMTMLWPELPDAAARNNLRQVLATLRRALRDESTDPPFLLTSRSTIQFNPDSDYTLDVTTFTELLEACKRHPHRSAESCRACAHRLQQAVELYRGPFLADFYLPDSVAFEEWAVVKREQLNQLVLAALTQLTMFHERRSQFAQAREYALRQLALEPWREAAHRQMMRFYLLEGDRNAALAQYEQCRAVLMEEFGVAPEAETTALYEQIRDASNDLPLDPERLAVPTHRRHTLPTQLTPFVGRESELAEISTLLASGECRLLTLAGPGGVGKTRLALQVGLEHLDAFSGGIFFVPLASLSSANLLTGAITNALGLEGSATDPKAHLLAQLRDKEILLVLDNFEHLLEGVDLLAEIQQQAPDVTLLVTSRQRLNLQGEWGLPVSGLPTASLPRNGAHPGVGQAVEQTDAVQLFVQSARRVRPGFSVVPENHASIVQICHMVAGLPLAIELAASWVRVLACEEIVREIERSSAFLTTTLRDIPARHRSMVAVLESAWGLLTDAEQRVLRCLALFRGGFRRAAAEQVAGATLPILAALVDKSFLQRDPTGRYTIHELMRQFAAEKLGAAGEGIEGQARHAAFYLNLAETAEPHLLDAEQATWLARLAEEHGNLRAALQTSLDAGELETAARIGGALIRFWDRHNHHTEGCTWFATIFAHPRASALPVAVQLKALFAAGSLARRQDDLPRATIWLGECLSASRQHSDTEWEAIALNSLGLLARRQGEISKAVTLYEESLALAREIGDQRTIVNALGNLGSIAMLQGEYDRAYTFHSEGLAFSREQGDLHGIAADLNNLGQVAFHRGAYAEATALQQECLALYRQLGDQRGILLALRDLGVIALQTGDISQAGIYFQEGLALSQEVGDKVGSVQFLERLARLALTQGNPTHAAHLWSAATRQRELLNTPLVLNELADRERQVTAAREQLTEQQFAEAWSAGRLRSLEQAVRYAQTNS